MSNKIVKTKTLHQVSDATREMGDTLATSFYISQDIKEASCAIKAYNCSLNALKTQYLLEKVKTQL